MEGSAALISPSFALTPCWICGAPADSAEHRVKAADVRAVFGKVTQAQPVYRHGEKGMNEPVRGVDVPALKFGKSICQQCNNARTQAHDRAWDRLRDALGAMAPPLRPGMALPTEQIFGDAARRHMLGVHLFLLKLLGCTAVEHRVSLPLKAFAVAILGGHSHPHVYLSFRIAPVKPGDAQIHLGDMRVLMHGKQAVSAQWFYSVGRLAVYAIYAERARPDIEGLWHPDDDCISPIVSKLTRVVSSRQSARRNSRPA